MSSGTYVSASLDLPWCTNVTARRLMTPEFNLTCPCCGCCRPNSETVATKLGVIYLTSCVQYRSPTRRGLNNEVPLSIGPGTGRRTAR
jgi:hypothetical protein